MALSGEGYILHIYIAVGGEGYTLYIHNACSGNADTPSRTQSWKENTPTSTLLTVDSDVYALTSTLLPVEMNTPSLPHCW